MKFEILTIKCPDCKGECRTVAVYFRSDKVLRLDGECDRCGTSLFLETTIKKALEHCCGIDLSEWNPPVGSIPN